MPILKNALGLDLGSYAVKAVEIRQTLRSFEAVQLHALRRVDEEIPLADLLSRFVALHRFATQNVVSALPGDQVSSRRLSFPFGDGKRLAQAVPFEVENDLPFDIDDFVVAWELISSDRSHAEVVATLAKRDAVSKVIGTLREAGCDPRTLEAEGLVLGNLATIFDLPGTRLLADFGHRKLTCCLLHEGRAIAARSFPIAGQALTEAIGKDRGFDSDDAERAKCEEGIFRSGLEATPQVSSVLQRICHELLRTVGAFEPTLVAAGTSRIEEITLLGGSAQIDRIDEYLAQNVSIPTKRLGLPIEELGESFVAGGPPLLYAPAIALALRGTTRTRTHMNFRQDEFAMRLDFSRYRRDFGSTAILSAIALLLAVLGFGTEALLDSRQAASIDAEIGRLYEEAFPGEPTPPNPVAALRDAVREANDRAEFLGVYRGNLSALDLLAEISRLVPPEVDVVIQELTIDHQTVRMRVRGKSFEAADRLGAELAKFGPFQTMRIGAIETDRKTGTKRFNVTISLGAGDGGGAS